MCLKLCIAFMLYLCIVRFVVYEVDLTKHTNMNFFVFFFVDFVFVKMQRRRPRLRDAMGA